MSAKPASQFLANPYNPRRHPQEQRAALRGVLAEVGWVTGVIENQRTGHLIDGHARIEEALSKNEDEPIPFIQVDLSEDEERLILASFDPLSTLAYNDKEQLDALLREVSAGDMAVQQMLSQLAESEGLYFGEEPKQEDESNVGEIIDRAAELQQKWQVQRGQIWQIGKHRLMCGDSTSAEDVARLLDGAEPYLMITDPPYGVDYDPEWRNKAAAEGKLAYAASRVGRFENDTRADWSDVYRLWPCKVLYTWSPGGDHIITTGKAIIDAGFEIRNQIIWAKPHFPISRGHYTYRHEPCWYAVRKGANARWIGPANESTLWQISLDKNVDGGHSTQKPIECMARPMRNHEGDVADPFLGSGTTIVAAEQTNRICYGVEIEPKYCAVTLERLSALGLTPELTNA